MHEISVVIPTFNHSDFVLQAINSVKNQSVPIKEIIIIDDGSTDETSEILQRVDGIKYHRQDNMGAHNAINRGIELSSGSHIAILNDDDLFQTFHINQAVDNLVNHGASICFSNPRIFGNGVMLDKYVAHMKKVDFLVGTRGHLASLLEINWFLSTSSMVFTRQHIEKVGYFSDFKLAHDWEFALRSIFRFESRFVVTTLPSWWYRIHGKNSTLSIMESTKQREIDEILKPYRDLMDS